MTFHKKRWLVHHVLPPLPTLGMLQLSAQTHLLPHLPRPPGLHQEPGHGEGSQLCPLPLQVRLIGLWSHPASHGQDGARRAVRVPAVLLPLPRSLLQVAGLSGRRHASPDASAQVHNHTAGQTPSSSCLYTHHKTSFRWLNNPPKSEKVSM